MKKLIISTLAAATVLGAMSVSFAAPKQAVHEQKQAVHEQKQTVHEQNQAVHEPNQAVHEQNQTIHEPTYHEPAYFSIATGQD